MLRATRDAPIAGSIELEPLNTQRPSHRLPKWRRRGIGIVGAGEIVRTAHLPAYQGAGFNVCAIMDQDLEAARLAAAEFTIPYVFERVEDLVACGEVEVVDIAVPPTAQVEIASVVISAGKHLLCQKPLADNYEDAVRLVAHAARKSVRLAVNQQLRWDPVVSITKQLIERGGYGELTDALFDIDLKTSWSPWLKDSPRLDYLFHTIHYLDAIRYLFGEPRSVSASMSRHPEQAWGGKRGR